MVTSEDLGRLRDELTRTIREEATETRTQLRALDDRLRTSAEQTARHDVRLDNFEEDQLDQWGVINGLRNGPRPAVAAVQTSTPTRRDLTRLGGALAVLWGLFEGLHQLLRLVFEFLKAAKGAGQ